MLYLLPMIFFVFFFLYAPLTAGASPCNAQAEETAINKLNTASFMMEKAREEAKDMTLPVNKYAEEGLKAAEECAEIFYSPEFQEEIICEQQRLEREVFGEYTASWKKKKQRPTAELAEQNDCLSDTEKIYLFFSSSVPDETVQAYIADIARANDPNVIPVMHGFVKGLTDMKVSTKYFSRILQKDPDCRETRKPCPRYQVEIKLRPLLFTKYGITQVPAVVYENEKNAFVIQGDAGLDYLLERINREVKKTNLTSLITKMRKCSPGVSILVETRSCKSLPVP